jgi:hypothetical protein
MKAPPIRIVSRVAAGLLGGYAFVWGFVTLGIALLLSMGMPYGDARTLVFLIAFLVLLVVFCWSFVAASLIRVWVVLAGGAMIMSGLAWLLMRTPIGA